MSITKAHLQIQAASDLSRFYKLMDELSDLAEKHPETKSEVARAVAKLDTIAQIHAVRNMDYFNLVDKIDIARDEYASLRRQNDALKEHNDTLQKTINKVLNDSI